MMRVITLHCSNQNTKLSMQEGQVGLMIAAEFGEARMVEYLVEKLGQSPQVRVKAGVRNQVPLGMLGKSL